MKLVLEMARNMYRVYAGLGHDSTHTHKLTFFNFSPLPGQLSESHTTFGESHAAFPGQL